MSFKTLRVKCPLCKQDGYDGSLEGLTICGLSVQELSSLKSCNEQLKEACTDALDILIALETELDMSNYSEIVEVIHKLEQVLKETL